MISVIFHHARMLCTFSYSAPLSTHSTIYINFTRGATLQCFQAQIQSKAQYVSVPEILDANAFAAM